MKTKRLKKFVLPTVYVMVIGVLFVSISFLGNILQSKVEYGNMAVSALKNNVTPVGKNEDIVESKIERPYVSSNVSISKSYYDMKDEEAKQQNSLVYYENTYLQNSGVSYGREASFDVVSILDGTVTSIKEDQNLGKIVEVTHSNDIISIYQSLSDVKVKENQEIKQGDIIGTSGTCNIENDLNNHLHFEMIVKGSIVNPENYYDKKISEL